MSDIYDAMRRDLESAMANASRPNAAELRRLRKENKRLHSVNAELLEACVYLVQGIEACGLTGVYLDQARAAISKAEEVKP